MNKEKYISLIAEKLNGIISQEDERTLNKWILESNENKAYFEELEAFWKKTETFEPFPSTDKDKLWNKIETEINSSTKEISINNKKFLSWQKIAAILVVALTISFYAKSVFYNSANIEISTAKNEVKNIILPDGSSIALNENSKLIYAKEFKTRNVTLEGEAFFEVTKDKTKPFTVKAFNSNTTVLGTSFNINAYLKQATEISLFTGKIRFEAEGNSIVLNPGDKIYYDNDKNVLFPKEVNNKNIIAWKTNELIFKNAKISNVVKDLNHYYHKEIIFNNTNLDCVFTGAFKDKDFTEVLSAISYVYDVGYQEKNNKIYFNTFECK